MTGAGEVLVQVREQMKFSNQEPDVFLVYKARNHLGNLEFCLKSLIKVNHGAVSTKSKKKEEELMSRRNE